MKLIKIFVDIYIKIYFERASWFRVQSKVYQKPTDNRNLHFVVSYRSALKTLQMQYDHVHDLYI